MSVLTDAEMKLVIEAAELKKIHFNGNDEAFEKYYNERIKESLKTLNESFAKKSQALSDYFDYVKQAFEESGVLDDLKISFNFYRHGYKEIRNSDESIMFYLSRNYDNTHILTELIDDDSNGNKKVTHPTLFLYKYSNKTSMDRGFTDDNLEIYKFLNDFHKNIFKMLPEGEYKTPFDFGFDPNVVPIEDKFIDDAKVLILTDNYDEGWFNDEYADYIIKDLVKNGFNKDNINVITLAADDWATVVEQSKSLGLNDVVIFDNTYRKDYEAKLEMAGITGSPYSIKEPIFVDTDGGFITEIDGYSVVPFDGFYKDGQGYDLLKGRATQVMQEREKAKEAEVLEAKRYFKNQADKVRGVIAGMSAGEAAKAGGDVAAVKNPQTP
ncbi:MAG: hypothetical protein LBM38_02430 [Clostridiales bacterium]|jgi:hypothetical protein|nr:hypothetical protein [Clostridiales bacterium]